VPARAWPAQGSHGVAGRRSLRLRLLGVVDARPQVAHGVAQRGELTRSDSRRCLIGTGFDLGERIFQRGDLPVRRRELILLRGDVAVRGGEPLLGVERILRDQLLQVFDRARELNPPVIAGLVPATPMAGHGGAI
jgi:hypothetical protein